MLKVTGWIVLCVVGAASLMVSCAYGELTPLTDTEAGTVIGRGALMGPCIDTDCCTVTIRNCAERKLSEEEPTADCLVFDCRSDYWKCADTDLDLGCLEGQEQFMVLCFLHYPGEWKPKGGGVWECECQWNQSTPHYIGACTDWHVETASSGHGLCDSVLLAARPVATAP